MTLMLNFNNLTKKQTIITYGIIIGVFIISLIFGVIIFINSQTKTIETFEFADKELTLKTGQSTRTELRVFPEGIDYEVKYSSSDETIATVDKDGRVTAVSKGIAVITAESGGLSSQIKFNVALNSIATLKIDGESISIKIGETNQLSYKVTPAGAGDIDLKWSSSDTAICDVDQSGVIRGISSGEAKITLYDGITEVKSTILVQVQEDSIISSISFKESNLTVNKGDDFIPKLIFDTEEIPYTELEWASSDNSIALVSEKGKVFPLSNGTCQITATYKLNSDITATLELKVIEPYVISDQSQGNNSDDTSNGVVINPEE